MNTLRVAWLFFKVGVMNELQYRVNFFVQLLQSLIQVGTGLVMLSLVYSHTTELNGSKESELLALLGVQIILGGFIHTFIQPNMELLMQDVQQGTLDYALTKPEDAQVLVSVRQVRIWQIVVFIVAIWGAYFVRSMFQATIGMLNFWTTRGAAIFDLYMATEMLLSGRLVPLKLMPGWVQTLADFLPFKWTFGFPIESLVSDMSTRSLLLGLGAQVMWTAIGYVLFTFAWRAAIKRFSAVGA